MATHINVREQPNAHSEVKGTLGKNESAELIESVPYWHKVKLVDDTEGYVSKAWTRVVSGATEVVSTTGKKDLIIGSWNIKWFGYYSQDRHDYPRMA